MCEAASYCNTAVADHVRWNRLCTLLFTFSSLVWYSDISKVTSRFRFNHIKLHVDRCVRNWYRFFPILGDYYWFLPTIVRIPLLRDASESWGPHWLWLTINDNIVGAPSPFEKSEGHSECSYKQELYFSAKIIFYQFKLIRIFVRPFLQWFVLNQPLKREGKAEHHFNITQCIQPPICLL